MRVLSHPVPRPRRAAIMLALAAVAVLLAGCMAGSTAAPGSTGGPTSSAAPPTQPPTTQPPSTTANPEPTEVEVSLRTFEVWRTQDGVPVGCDAIGIGPVVGTLEGDPEESTDPVWLAGPSGQRLSIVWPEGFTARFTPSVELLDERGTLVASAGDVVILQVDPDEAGGSFADPYVASGIMLAGPDLDPNDPAAGIAFQGCYPRDPR